MIKWLTRRERVFLFGAVGVVVVFALYNFAIEPAVKKWEELDQNIQAQKAKLFKMVRLVGSRDEITSEYKKYEDLLKQKGAREEELASFLNELETLARKSNVKISDIKPQPIKEEEFYDGYAALVEIEATMEQLIKFLRELEISPELLLVERLQISVKAAAPGVLKSQLLISRILLK